MKKTFNARQTVNTVCLLLVVFLPVILMNGGCANHPKEPMGIEVEAKVPDDNIISSASGQSVSFEDLMTILSKVQVIYIGESHTHKEDHQIQLKIIESLYKSFPNLKVGMEMFDQTYQARLDSWSSGIVDEISFLRNVHWYANWRYDFSLYRDILLFIRANHIPLIGLNIPFYIPPKIAIGGIESLSEEEKRHLPEKIDQTDVAHREYVYGIFAQHRIPGRDHFDFFYSAQCVWEDGMAEAISRHLSSEKMVVLVGNGHIYRKFGIPNRAFQRTKAEYRTIYLVESDNSIELAAADFIWITHPALKSVGNAPSTVEMKPQ
jgi:uncharacterized iron-regulated protein